MARMHHMWALNIRTLIKYGEMYATSEKLEGIAGWLPPNHLFPSIWNFIRCGGIGFAFRVGRKILKRVMHVEEFFITMRKRNATAPYWYFGPLGVDPEYQGRGYASKLLNPMLQRIDEEDLPVYLETTKEANISLYEHFEFQVLEEKRIPETEMTNWAMLRQNKSMR